MLFVCSFALLTLRRSVCGVLQDILFDDNLVPSQNYTGEGTLALPKLNLQFLTFHDYLLRNFNLFRLESTYEIREDLALVVER